MVEISSRNILCKFEDGIFLLVGDGLGLFDCLGLNFWCTYLEITFYILGVYICLKIPIDRNFTPCAIPHKFIDTAPLNFRFPPFSTKRAITVFTA